MIFTDDGLDQSISHMSNKERTVLKRYLNKEYNYILNNPTNNASYFSIFNTIHDFRIPKPNIYDTVIIPAKAETIVNGTKLRHDRIMMIKRAGLYTGELDNNIKSIRFKNEMQKSINQIRVNALYTETRDLFTFHLTTKEEMIEYLVMLYFA